MRISVTGGSGKLGRAAIRSLKAAGHRVVNLDLRPSPDGVRTVSVDCTDFGETLGALSGIDLSGGPPDAVLHLAGIPMPGMATDQRTFEINTVATYNVFSACARLGVKTVAWASSETIMGLPYETPPDFAPVDETHPDRPGWSYALSKVVGETLAENFARWNPSLSITSLRFSNVYDEADYALLPQVQKRPELRKSNLWAYVDARDCGEACRLALEAAPTGHNRLIIAAGDTIMETPTAELLAELFPAVTVRRTLSRNESILCSASAMRLIGYSPQHSWRAA
jgi:nucleoside-diphosphate-sugar epimerase